MGVGRKEADESVSDLNPHSLFIFITLVVLLLGMF